MSLQLSRSYFEKPDVLLITVTSMEAETVLELFESITGERFQRKFIGPKTYFDLGIVHGTKVFMVQSEMGSGGPGGSQITATEAIRTLTPSIVIMVGIAFGLRPGKQLLGDVLVSDRILYYEPQRVGKKLIIRGPRPQASTLLLDRFRSAVYDWPKPTPDTKVHFGLLLTGEKLIDNMNFRKRLLGLEPEAIGGEMEGAGLYSAAEFAQVPWIIVKAICDWADGDKNNPNKNQDQYVAARNAAGLVLHVISLGSFASAKNANLKESVASSAFRNKNVSRSHQQEEEKRLAALQEEYKYVNEQWLNSIDQQQRIVLKRKLLSLEKEIELEENALGRKLEDE